jgi:hypothetical protein
MADYDEDRLLMAAKVQHLVGTLCARLDKGDPLTLDLDATMRFVAPSVRKEMAPEIERYGDEVERLIEAHVRAWLGYGGL